MCFPRHIHVNALEPPPPFNKVNDLNILESYICPEKVIISIVSLRNM